MSAYVLLADSTTTTAAKPQPQPKASPGTVQTMPSPPLLWSPFRGEMGARTDVLALGGIVVLFTVLLFGWALFFRRPSSRSLAGRGGVLTDRPSGSRRRRRSRRPEMPSNPTLKERGGLPPPRDQASGTETRPPGQSPPPS